MSYSILDSKSGALLTAAVRSTSKGLLGYNAAIELALTDSYQNVKGPWFWKMNVSLLEDGNYLNDLKDKFPQWKTTGANNLSDKRSVWDWLKYNIRDYAISYSKQKAKERNIKEKSLQTTYEESNKNVRSRPY